MAVSTSGFGYPSAVIDVVVMSFNCDIVLETTSPLDDIFANERIIECGLKSGAEHVFEGSCFGLCGLD